MRRISLISIFVFFLNILIFPQISDIKKFLDQCPTNDPVINTILSDFEIRLNGIKVTEFPCTEPVSAMSAENYSNPLIYLQTLRVIYYMDRNMTGKHLPWTDKILYDWMKENVDGIDIKDGVSGGYCCEIINGKKFFVTGNQDDFNREFDKKWIGIAGNIDFFSHEVRHTNGNGYSHSSCCGLTNGCDNTYNENDLSPYGIQYWLNKSWLTGFINVGARTSHSQNEINEIINWHLGAINYTFRDRFCNNSPDIVNLADIENPLGAIPTYVKNVELKKVNLFPNPINNGTDLTINIPNTSLCKIEIINTTGILLKVIKNNKTEGVTIASIDLKPDIYIIKIQDDNGNLYYQKLIVK